MDASAVTIRPALHEDFEAVAELFNGYEADSVNAETFLGRLRRWQEGDPRLDVVAEGEDGKVIGYGSSSRRASDPAGKFSVQVVVSQSQQGHGLGRRLMSFVEGFAGDYGATHLMVYVKERIDRGVAFAKAAGFLRVQRLFDSEVDVSEFDFERWLPLIDHVKRLGYRLSILADIGDTEEHRRRLFELDVTTDVDTPGFENWGRRSYEQYSRDEFQSFGFSPGCVVIAEFEGEWVAMHSCRQSPKAGTMTIDYTGVVREHRGRGLAQAVKVLGIEQARRAGARKVRTSNDERNAAMLAVNEKLGFKPEPGFFVFKKDV